MNITDMQLVGSGQDALGDGITAGNDERVGRQIELLDRVRHDGQITAIFPLSERQILDERRCGPSSSKETPLLLWNEIHECKYVGVRSDRKNLLQNAFSPAVDCQPVMYDRNLRRQFDTSKAFVRLDTAVLPHPSVNLWQLSDLTGCRRLAQFSGFRALDHSRRSGAALQFGQ